MRAFLATHNNNNTRRDKPRRGREGPRNMVKDDFYIIFYIRNCIYVFIFYIFVHLYLFMYLFSYVFIDICICNYVFIYLCLAVRSDFYVP